MRLNSLVYVWCTLPYQRQVEAPNDSGVNSCYKKICAVIFEKVKSVGTVSFHNDNFISRIKYKISQQTKNNFLYFTLRYEGVLLLLLHFKGAQKTHCILRYWPQKQIIYVPTNDKLFRPLIDYCEGRSYRTIRQKVLGTKLNHIQPYVIILLFLKSGLIFLL